MINSLVRPIYVVLPGVAIIASWQIAVWLNPEYEFFVGSPWGVMIDARALWDDGTLARDIGVTGLEAVLGFLVGSLMGTVVGLLLWLSTAMASIARPYLVALGSVPAFALGPMLIFWFGTGILSKTALGFFSTFVIAVTQAYSGALEADSNLLKMVKAFGGGKRQQFLRIIVPSASIWVIAGIRLNIGMALLGAFVGEFLSSSIGLGHLIIVAEGLYDVNQIWVGVLGIIFIATLFNLLTSPIERWANRWK